MIGLPGIPELEEGDDLGQLLADACARVGGLEHGDVVVVAQKVVSKVEGRVVRLDEVEPSSRAVELAGKITSGSAIDAGPLASARALEGMTAVIVNVNKRYKAHAGLRVTGVH